MKKFFCIEERDNLANSTSSFLGFIWLIVKYEVLKLKVEAHAQKKKKEIK